MRLVHDLGRNGALFFASISPLRRKQRHLLRREIGRTFGAKVSAAEVDRLAKAAVGYQVLGAWDRRFPESINVQVDVVGEGDCLYIAPRSPFEAAVRRAIEIQGREVIFLPAPIASRDEADRELERIRGKSTRTAWLTIRRTGISTLKISALYIEPEEEAIRQRLDDFVREVPAQYGW